MSLDFEVSTIAPKRVGRRLVWNPQEVIDYRGRRCAISRKELVYGE